MTDIRTYVLRHQAPWLRTLLYLLQFGFLHVALSHIWRGDGPMMWLTIGGSVLVYLLIVYHARHAQWREMFAAAILLRLALLFTPVHLSDDIFRFSWDGQKVKQGESPYHNPPQSDEHIEDWPELYNRMNSAIYYSPYPPVCQYIWALTTNPEGHPEALRTIFIILDSISIWLLYRLLIHYQKPTWYVLWYAFNPLILVEGIGQLHPELIVITLMLWMLTALNKHQFSAVGCSIGLAICTKLWPLLAMILLLQRLSIQQWLKVSSIALGVCILLYAPLLDPSDITGMLSSFQLYFQSFEFNASIYYVLKSVYCFYFTNAGGAGISKILGVCCLIYLIYLIRQSRISYILALYLLTTVQMLTSAVVHPWYLIPLVMYGLLAGRWTGIVWSIVVFLSYSHYGDGMPAERPLWIAIEYAIVAISLIIEYLILKENAKATNAAQQEA